jgi:hypothetical protein
LGEGCFVLSIGFLGKEIISKIKQFFFLIFKTKNK